MFQSKKLLNYFVTLIFSLLFCLVAINTYGSSETSLKIIPISPSALLITYICMISGLRFWKKTELAPTVLQKMLLVLSVFLGVLAAATSLYWANTPVNQLFELTKLHPQGILQLWLLSTITWVVHNSDTWWQKNWKKVVFVLPFLGFFTIYVISLWPFNILKEIVKEDRIIEYLQFYVLFAGSLYHLIISYFLIRNKQYLYSVISILTAIGLFAIAGDEISWGQRIIGFEASEEFKAVNRQDETTFHNLVAVEWLVIYSYIFLSFIGLVGRGFMTLLGKIQPKTQFLRKFTADYMLIGYFLLSFIYFEEQYRVMWGRWHSWSEPAELSLYLGLVLWACSFTHTIFKKKYRSLLEG